MQPSSWSESPKSAAVAPMGVQEHEYYISKTDEFTIVSSL